MAAPQTSAQPAASGPRKIERDHYLFREGDPPDAMYVVKSGKLAVVKTKNNTEIVLAEIGAGAMVGEMAFFDNKPRSASVKAIKDSEVIALPYRALHAQFAGFPEWCKAIMRTVNESLRNANVRIKQLEKSEPDTELFPPHTITKLISILNLVVTKYGKPAEDGNGFSVGGNIIRNYTIQIFQEPTHKMQKMMSALADMGFMKVEDLGEGRQRITVLKPDVLYSFVEWYNEWLFKRDTERVTVKEEEIRTLNGILHFANKLTPDDKGMVKLNLTEIQNDSMKEVGTLVRVEETLPLIEKKIMGDQMMKDGAVYSTCNRDELAKIIPFWQIIYTLKRVTR